MRRIHMAFVDKERFRMFAMRRSIGMMQNPKVTKAIVKAFEHGNKTKAKIDDTVNKMARTFNLVVKNEIIETNHSIRALEDNVRELSENVEDLRKQIDESALKKKKADQPSD
jgi:flagellar motility protein MotE (MotC chaperone)